MDVEFSNESLRIDADSVTRSKKRPWEKEFNDVHVLKKTKGKGKGQSEVSDVDKIVWHVGCYENKDICDWLKVEERVDEKGNTKSQSLLLHCFIQIPDEILMYEILPRLPVKSLSRFKCVSKSWKSLIESDRFMKIQYRNSAKNPRFIFDFDYYTMQECSLHLLLNSKEESGPTKKQAMSGALVGCCNGVVCCFNPQNWRFSLWNPAIRVRIELPDNGCRYTEKCGFGWDESTGAYKVFAVLSKYSHTKKIGKIFSSNTQSWRTIPRGSPSVHSVVGVFVHGNLHWVDWCHPQIECFDLEREEFGRIGLPLENAFHFPVLGEIGKSLSILIDWEERLEVWVMKEYGVKDSWFKLLMFPPHISVSKPRAYPFHPFFGEGFNGDIFMIYRFFRVFTEDPNGEILACDEENLTIYSPKDDAFSICRKYVKFTRPCLYVESLVSPKRILDAMPPTPTPLGEEEEKKRKKKMKKGMSWPLSKRLKLHAGSRI
ncbi:hypothetical protein OROGR_023441 [Orobanche gracilis]